MSAAAMRVARGHDGQQAGKLRLQLLVDAQGQRLFAGMGRGGDPDLAPADLAGQDFELGRIAGRRIDVIFDVPDRTYARRAQLQQAAGVVIALRQAQVDLAEQGADEAGKPPPAREGARRQPGVDQSDGNFARMNGVDGVGPEFRFGQHEKVGAPMIEETLDITRRVERHILVTGAGGQPLGENAGGGYGAAGDQNMEAFCRQPRHQGQQRETFADAGAMQPGQPALRPGQAGDAAPFAKPFAILLAALGAPPQEDPAEGREAVRQGAIDRQKELGLHEEQSLIARLAASTSKRTEVLFRSEKCGPPLPFFISMQFRFASGAGAAPHFTRVIAQPRPKGERRAPGRAKNCGR